MVAGLQKIPKMPEVTSGNFGMDGERTATTAGRTDEMTATTAGRIDGMTATTAGRTEEAALTEIDRILFSIARNGITRQIDPARQER